MRIGSGNNISPKLGEKARNGYSLSIYSTEAEIWETSAIELARAKRKLTRLRETDIFPLSRAKEAFGDSCPVMSAEHSETFSLCSRAQSNSSTTMPKNSNFVLVPELR
jgi:hypothetical protein